MKTPIKHALILILASALMAAFSTSCATTQGFGRDVETLGGNIEKSAR